MKRLWFGSSKGFGKMGKKGGFLLAENGWRKGRKESCVEGIKERRVVEVLGLVTKLGFVFGELVGGFRKFICVVVE